MATPGAASVNRPTDVKVKERDINNKLQLYGIYSAFTNGKVPSNKQIDVALNSVLASRGLGKPSARLSTEGQKLVADFRDVIEQAKVLLLTKNEGNLLQDFVWQTQHIGTGQASTPGAPIDKNTAQQHGSEALDGLRTLGTLIISNGQFRKLLSDATVLFRDIAGDAAQNAANRVNPSQEQLSQIDRPAADDTWHDVPDVSRGNFRDQVKSKLDSGKNAAQQVTGDATQAAHPGDSRDPAAAADLAVKDYRNTGNTGGANVLEGARAAADSTKQKIAESVPEDHKERTRYWQDRSREYLRGKVPQERREQIIWRLKKTVVEIQGHQDYNRAIDTLLRLAEEYTGHSRNLTGQAQSSVKQAHSDNSLRTVEADLKTLLERFANYTSFDDLIDSINQIYRDADNDPELKGWFTQIDSFIRRLLKEQGFILQDQSTTEWNELYDRGHNLLRNKYRGHTDRIVDELKYLGDQFDRDQHNRAFAASMNKLFNDLGTDDQGKTTFKPHLVKDVTGVILPSIFENTRYIPIPRIEYTDPTFDAVVENLVIESDNLTPNILEVTSDNHWRWGRKNITSTRKNKVVLYVSGIQMDLRDVSYYIKRKHGFPTLSDIGVADIQLRGRGLSFKVHMETADEKDRAHFFKIERVEVDAKGLNINLKQSKRKFLFNLVKPLLLKFVRPVLEKVLEKQIKDQINELDEVAWKIYKEADRAQQEAKDNPDPANLQNIYQRYVNAAQQQFFHRKRQAEEVAKDKKVNVAVTKQDSMFKNISLPGGISTKATEYKELAAQGDKWESPVFSIGSSGESSNLPKASSVSRRSQRTSGGVSGGTGGYATGTSHSGYGTGSTGTAAGTGVGNDYGTSTGARTGHSAGTGYSAGTGNSVGQGYSTSTGTGTGTHGVVGGTTNNSNQAFVNGNPSQSTTAGFSNQVNQAFGDSGNTGDYRLNQDGTKNTQNTTTLGSNNPVLTGNV